MIHDFDKKVVVITGATGGLGRSVSQAFSKQACTLFITDIHAIKIEELKQTLSEEKKNDCVIDSEVMDVSSEEEVKRVYRNIINRYGGVDILINIAGYIHYNNIFDLSVNEWDKVIDTNLKGVFLTTKYFGISMKERNKGKIVNISSVAAASGVYGGGAYSSSKSGLLGMTRVLAKELAEFNINVNAISPGPLDGDFLNDNSDEAGRKMRIEKTLFKRIGLYRDIVNPILFLASSQADWITGQNLFVDGGYTVQ